MRLTPEEEEILAGRWGGSARRALEMQIEVGGFFAAERMVRVTSAHLTGDADSMGDAGLTYVEALARDGGRFVVPTTTNARNVDFECYRADKVFVCPVAKGGFATSWAPYDLRARGLAPVGAGRVQVWRSR